MGALAECCVWMIYAILFPHSIRSCAAAFLSLATAVSNNAVGRGHFMGNVLNNAVNRDGVLVAGVPQNPPWPAPGESPAFLKHRKMV